MDIWEARRSGPSAGVDGKKGPDLILIQLWMSKFGVSLCHGDLRPRGITLQLSPCHSPQMSGTWDPWAGCRIWDAAITSGHVHGTNGAKWLLPRLHSILVFPNPPQPLLGHAKHPPPFLCRNLGTRHGVVLLTAPCCSCQERSCHCPPSLTQPQPPAPRGGFPCSAVQGLTSHGEQKGAPNLSPSLGCPQVHTMPVLRGLVWG